MKAIICTLLLSLSLSSFAGQRQQQQASQGPQKAPNPNANQHSQTLDIQYELEGIRDDKSPSNTTNDETIVEVVVNEQEDEA